MVTHRRRRLFPLCGSQKVMDNPDANHHRFHDALDVVFRPGIDGQRLYPLPFLIIFELRLELMHRCRQPNMYPN